MKKIILSIIVAGITVISHAQSIEPFKDGDRIVFLGNSITDGGHYHSYIWLYYMTHFPNMPITIFNGGIGGDTAYDMYKRLDGDIFSKKPSVLIVTFGMNDSGYFEYNGDNASEFAETKYQECINNYKLIEKRLLSLPSTRIIMAGTSHYDETVEIAVNTVFKKKNETIKKIICYQIESAKQNKWEYIDWNAPMLAINRERQKKNPKFTLCGGDRIHPDNDGHMVMAYLFLKAQGFAGQCVADMEINAMKQKAEKAINCEITDIKKTGKELSFSYLSESLPYPLDTIARGWGSKHSQAEAAEYVPFTQKMNSETLKIHGLQGQYKLLIDNEEIGIWSGKELSKGINLAIQTKHPSTNRLWLSCTSTSADGR